MLNCGGKKVAVIGGGPAGLIAAELLIEAGAAVDVYDSMPTLGRKFLRAGLGGLNITHSEPFDVFCSRYSDRQENLQPMLDAFPPNSLCDWVHRLGISTFVGSSGRVFPQEMKAAPLLRTWVHRLRNSGAHFYFGHKWTGIGADGSIRLSHADGELEIKPDAVLLALGGASWPQLGSTGEWLDGLKSRGVNVAPWRPANCAFEIPWSEHLREKFDGAPLKAVTMTFTSLDGVTETKQGELLIKEWGIEGGLLYAFSKRIREMTEDRGNATFFVDLVPDRTLGRVASELSRPRGSQTLSRFLQGVLGKDALKRALLHEVAVSEQMEDPLALSMLMKALPITVSRIRTIDEAISSAGGICFDSVDDNLMLKNLPGIFVAGEMLDWEAPTGGYLLTACFATGRWSATGVAKWLNRA